MPKSPSNQPVVLPIIGAIITNAKHAAVLLLGLALIAGPPQIVFGQSSQQQEQQRREQQERERQQRDQQQREQQAREQQQRDQQQREQQAREQQQRDQQQPSFSDSAAQTSNARSEGSRVTAVPPSTEIKRTTSEVQPLGAGRKIESAPAANAKELKDHVSSPGGPDSRRSSGEDG